MTSETVGRIVGVIVVFVQYIAPISVIIICYGKIIFMLSKRVNFGIKYQINGRGTSNVGTRQKSNTFALAKRNTIKTCTAIAICFIACWTQNQIQYFMYLTGFYIDWKSTYFQFGFTIIFVNCTTNPLVYLVLYKDFQTGLQALFGCVTQGSDSTESSLPYPAVSTVSTAGKQSHSHE